MMHPVSARLARKLLLIAGLSGLFATSLAEAQSLSSVMFFNGSQAQGNVTFGTDGSLYGLAGYPQGLTESVFGTGAVGGLIYRLSPDAGRVDSIYQYGNPATFLGTGPRGALVSDGAGNFYGVTQFNAMDPTPFLHRVGSGTVFKTSSDGKTYTVLHSFTTSTSTEAPILNDDGISPMATLLLKDGFLYGTTTVGGANGTGTIFRIATDGSGFIVLHNFAPVTSVNNDLQPINDDGASATTRLIFASNGYLYGVNSAGGINGTGTIYRLRIDGSEFSVLFSFDVSPILDTGSGTLQTNSTGSYPQSGLLEAGVGWLYGTTNHEGANGYGNVYRIAFDGTQFTALQSFDGGSNGANPRGELLLASDGTIVGTTSGGATQSDGTTPGAGTLFSMTLDGSSLNTLYVFGAVLFGAAPTTGVVQSSDGSFYGTTSQGGPYNQGTVYKYGGAITLPAQGTPQPTNSSKGAMEWPTIAMLGLIWLATRRRRVV
jgi:uncharacterized repeat protein (TIGR03803 family)